MFGAPCSDKPVRPLLAELPQMARAVVLAGAGKVSLLTPREKEVMAILGVGLRTKDVAAKLNISVHTAKAHKDNIMQKLNIHSSVALAWWWQENGWIQ